MIKYIYTFFLGLLLATFIGVGVSTFYTAPKFPDYPMSYVTSPANPTPEEKQQQKDLDAQQKQYQTDLSVYNRNTSSIILIFALVILVVSLGFAHRLDMLADGLLLGGVFTLIYSIGRGLASEDPKYRFIVTSVGLVVALVLGYIKFIRPKKQ